METWIAANWDKILLSLVTTGALTFCGFLWKQVLNYKKLLQKDEDQKFDDRIEEKIQPIIEDMEGLRNYVREVDKNEKHKIDLIV